MPVTPEAVEVSSAAARILVVAEPSLAGIVQLTIEAAGDIARSVGDAAEAPEVARSWKPHVVVIGASLPATSLGDLVARVKSAHPCACALLVSTTTGEMVSLADRCGADMLLVQPLDAVVLKRILHGELQHSAVPRPAADTPRLPALVGAAGSPMCEVWRFVLLAAPSDSSVVLSGETGVGKEVLAHALHRFSARRGGPFVAINCAAIPENLLESELFGHEKGAFTGATAQHRGRFEMADGGTLFLDEIGDLSLGLQVKLLRVLQERRFERVGGTETVSIDVRIIAATHRNLEDEVRRERFRSDLYYRLSVLSVRVPALRERKGDIIALWDDLLAEGAARDNRRVPRASGGVQRLLLKHDWPGNVRELQNVAQHALTLATGDALMPADLPAYLSGQAESSALGLNLVGLTMKEIEKLAIVQSYEALGTVGATAEALGISMRKIHYRLKEYRADGMEVRRPPALEAEQGRRVRVLLAEDDDDLRWALCDFLKGQGYDVVSVPDGRVLLEHLGSAMLLGRSDFPADLIVTDIRMPGLTGMQILERVRERGWKTPVVVISAYGDADTRRQAEELGAVFVEKPLDMARLHEVLSEQSVGVVR